MYKSLWDTKMLNVQRIRRLFDHEGKEPPEPENIRTASIRLRVCALRCESWRSHCRSNSFGLSQYLGAEQIIVAAGPGEWKTYDFAVPCTSWTRSPGRTSIKDPQMSKIVSKSSAHGFKKPSDPREIHLLFVSTLFSLAAAKESAISISIIPKELRYSLALKP